MDFDGAECIERLRELPGLGVKVTSGSSSRFGDSDFGLSLTTRSGKTEYKVEAKSSVTTTGVPVLLGQLKTYTEAGKRTLLLAPYISPSVGKALRAEQQEYVDAAGNLYLTGSAIYAHVEGKKNSAVVATNLTVTDLKVTLAILAAPWLIHEGYRAIANVANASIGAVSKTVNKLERLGHLHRRSRRQFMVAAPQNLVERWELGYAEQLRKEFKPSYWKPLPVVKVSDLVRQSLNMDSVLLGGEHAAAVMLPNLFTPGTVTLHVYPNATKKVAGGLRLAPSVEGAEAVTILEGPQFGGDHPSLPSNQLVDPVLVRAELLYLGDSRLRTVADKLLQQKIVPRFQDA